MGAVVLMAPLPDAVDDALLLPLPLEFELPVPMLLEPEVVLLPAMVDMEAAWVAVPVAVEALTLLAFSRLAQATDAIQASGRVFKNSQY